MDFHRLKQLVGKLGGLLVLDGDEPAFVVLPYDKYQKMEAGPLRPSESEASEEIQVSSRPARSILAEVLRARVNDASETSNEMNGFDGASIANGADSDETMVEKLNQEILVLKEEIRQKEEAELVVNEQSTEPIAEAIDLD